MKGYKSERLKWIDCFYKEVILKFILEEFKKYVFIEDWVCGIVCWIIIIWFWRVLYGFKFYVLWVVIVLLILW